MKEFFSLEGQGVAEEVQLRIGQELLSTTGPLPGASGCTSSAWPPVPPLLLTGCQTRGKHFSEPFLIVNFGSWTRFRFFFLVTHLLPAPFVDLLSFSLNNKDGQ